MFKLCYEEQLDKYRQLAWTLKNVNVRKEQQKGPENLCEVKDLRGQKS